MVQPDAGIATQGRDAGATRAESAAAGAWPWHAPRFILSGLLSARYFSVTPRMGSRGASGTCPNHPAGRACAIK